MPLSPFHPPEPSFPLPCPLPPLSPSPRSVMSQRLLHAGASASSIIHTYISTIKVLAYIEQSGECPPPGSSHGSTPAWRCGSTPTQHYSSAPAHPKLVRFPQCERGPGNCFKIPDRLPTILEKAQAFCPADTLCPHTAPRSQRPHRPPVRRGGTHLLVPALAPRHRQVPGGHGHTGGRR